MTWMTKMGENADKLDFCAICGHSLALLLRHRSTWQSKSSTFHRVEPTEIGDKPHSSRPHTARHTQIHGMSRVFPLAFFSINAPPPKHQFRKRFSDSLWHANKRVEGWLPNGCHTAKTCAALFLCRLHVSTNRHRLMAGATFRSTEISCVNVI